MGRRGRGKGGGREKESGGKGRRETEERGRKDFPNVSPYTSHTFTYLLILSNVPIYLLYTRIYLKISNIRNTRADLRPQNDHNSSPRASPRVRI